MGLLQIGWLNERLDDAGFETIMIRQRSSYDLACLTDLVTLIRKKKIEIVHAHEFMMNTYGALAGVLTRTPVITTVHGKNYYWEKRRRRVAYRFVSRFSRMVAVSDDLGSFLAKEIGIAKSRISTIYNGVDFGGCKNGRLSSGAFETARESLAIPAQSPVIITVGMLVSVKDHLTLLKAAANVVRSFPDAILIICGDGELRGSLEDAARQLQITKNIRFAGFRTDVFNLLQLANVYVCSSVSEGLSLSILEAMMVGKPVVATNVGGNPEVVSDEQTGFIVPPRNAEVLASKIALLLQDRRLAQEFGANGRRRAGERFSHGRMVDAYGSLYKKALVKN
jgi:glycosyltransferase involved in cell wall biosynthesis